MRSKLDSLHADIKHSLQQSLFPSDLDAMPNSNPIASFLAVAGLITATKSAWELSRMIRAKRDIRQRADRASKELSRAYMDGRLSGKDWRSYDSKLKEAVERNDSTYSTVMQKAKLTNT
jgi:hypothetical protein